MACLSLPKTLITCTSTLRLLPVNLPWCGKREGNSMRLTPRTLVPADVWASRRAWIPWELRVRTAARHGRQWVWWTAWRLLRKNRPPGLAQSEWIFLRLKFLTLFLSKGPKHFFVRASQKNACWPGFEVNFDPISDSRFRRQSYTTQIV